MCIFNLYGKDNGCGTVGGAVTYKIRGTRFKSSHIINYDLAVQKFFSNGRWIVFKLLTKDKKRYQNFVILKWDLNRGHQQKCPCSVPWQSAPAKSILKSCQIYFGRKFNLVVVGSRRWHRLPRSIKSTISGQSGKNRCFKNATFTKLFHENQPYVDVVVSYSQIYSS